MSAGSPSARALTTTDWFDDHRPHRGCWSVQSGLFVINSAQRLHARISAAGEFADRATGPPRPVHARPTPCAVAWDTPAARDRHHSSSAAPLPERIGRTPHPAYAPPWPPPLHSGTPRRATWCGATARGRVGKVLDDGPYGSADTTRLRSMAMSRRPPQAHRPVRAPGAARCHSAFHRISGWDLVGGFRDGAPVRAVVSASGV